MATKRTKKPTSKKAARPNEGLITGAHLVIGFSNTKAKRTKKGKKRSAATFLVEVGYIKKGVVAKKQLPVEDAATFHSILLMMRVGPAFYLEGENCIELASTQPSSLPGLTQSADTKLKLA